MSHKGRAGFNQYSKGASHSSRMSRATHDFSQASALNDTLQIQQTHSVDSHVQPKKPAEDFQYMIERYGMSWADSESKTRRLLTTLMLRSQSSHQELLELDSELKVLANRITNYTSSSSDHIDASKQACCLLERVLEMKADFYDRLDSALSQLNDLSSAHSNTLYSLESEKMRVEALTKELGQLRIDYSACRDANIAQAASLTDTQMQLLETSSVLENARKSITAFSTENSQLKESLQITATELTNVKNAHYNQIESFETLLERSSTREQALLKELEELQMAYINERDMHVAKIESMHQLSNEMDALHKQLSDQRKRVRRYKIRMGQLRRTAKELRIAIQRNAVMAHNDDLLKQKDAQIAVIVKKLEEYRARAKRVSAYECKIASQKGEIERLSTCMSALEQDLDRYKAKRLRLSAPPKIMTASKDGKMVQLSISDDAPRSEGFFASTRSYCTVI